MKRKLLLGIVCVIGAYINAYDTIDEALSNGISNGDVVFFSSNTNVYGDTHQSMPRQNDLTKSAYSVGSLGLAYRSGFYKSWRFMVSFRASENLYQAHKDSLWTDDINSPGRSFSNQKGDAAKDFYAPAMLGQSYLEYFHEDTSIRTGRVFVKSEWADRLIDGVHIRNKSFENIIIEAFWAKSSGYVQYNKLSGLIDVNPNSRAGLLNTSIKYTLNDMFSLKAQAIYAAQLFNAFSAKAAFRYEISNSYIGANAQFTASFEDINSPYRRTQDNDTFVFDTRAYIGVKDFIDDLHNGLEISGGFIRSGENGIGSLNAVGNNISPFFMWGGRAFLVGSNASLGFAKIHFTIDRISLALVYGSTHFQKPFGLSTIYNGFDRVNEVNFLLDFSLSEHTSAIFNLLNTHKGKAYYPHTTLINFGIKLSF
ncbi:MAG: Opr family porin [Helicobacter sp.]|nr:Opr family porin [Helicobacter sp.]